MFDLHSHILPGLDDGAKTLEEAVEMVRMAAGDGTRAILATPHSRDVQEAAAHETVREKVDELRKEAKRQGIDIEILLGMENHMTPDLLELVDRGEGYPINGHNYILVELPFTIYPNYADELLFQLQLRGLTPLIAHPERQEAIQRDPDIMEGLVQRGILGQVTAMSITGKFGSEAQKSAHTLMRRNLVHVIASDGHRPKGPRTPVMAEAVTYAAKIVGPERADAMAVLVPQAILEGRTVDLESLPRPTHKKGWRPWSR